MDKLIYFNSDINPLAIVEHNSKWYCHNKFIKIVHTEDNMYYTVLFGYDGNVKSMSYPIQASNEFNVFFAYAKESNILAIL